MYTCIWIFGVVYIYNNSRHTRIKHPVHLFPNYAIKSDVRSGSRDFQTLKGGGGNARCPILHLSPLLEINFKEANTRSLMTKCERI